ncbi:hypothetical protein L226DRAFT_460309 [Lentinus tigrinus ALCF2SS1-7]|uniref:Zn(2)-C6 fungal-type domain-containing protein n=1 Tax=Lentinus tigrinus ALCF2SS1-6 TaxID=1328759 RepID=A0A5C2SM90_9APHY|nr:hypothetical protein L227DRAFT_495533 [Lentinus tigrinus ALCF2SS1-6]RPD76604.1 hypothetical protein L226DRAFT_460309 [Lentinus tigrinus ALCF2SS1-7]
MASSTPSQPSPIGSNPPTSKPVSPNVTFVAPADRPRAPELDHVSVAFVKGAKRKRLSKACDACHKSKRRCDGTAPCSNCYYASKNCTYTDAAGRPVPAPRINASAERAAIPNATVIPAIPATEAPPWAGQATLATPSVPQQSTVERDPSTKRSRKGPGAPDSSPPMGSTGSASPEAAAPPLDPALAHELVNIFFAHCNPQRMVIHKPSFIADFGLNKVPYYLLLAVCALAAPLCKTIASKASHPRLAGVPFFQNALALMFDNSGRLLSEPTVSTAQALCLLEMHEIAASHSWTRHFRYFELALQVLEGSLHVDRPDNSAPASPSDPDAVMHFIDGECTRRCFWLMQLMAWISHIYTHRGVRPRMAELADIVRLPIDETTFELASLTTSATSEYMRRPAPRTRYASQFGHVLRILEIYHNVETVLTNKEGPARLAAITPLRKELDEWAASLPSHLQFTEDNLDTQITMFETSSNSGAWCFCFIHALHPCCHLAILEGEGKLGDPIPWVRNQLNLIFNAAGTRAKTSILSACALWSYSKYSGDDPQIHVWDRDFEKLWGFKVVAVAEQWRQSQAKEKERAHAAAQQQQQLQQMYQPREPKSSSNSPTSAHSSPGLGGHVQAVAQPYEGRREGGNPRALLRSNVSMPDLESVAYSHAHAHAHAGAAQTNLPSLKQSGLLDSWKPPSEAFANSLSLGAQNVTQLREPPPGRMQMQMHQNQGAAAAIPSNLWSVDSGGGGRL